MPQGNDDTTVASRKILDGESMINGDFSPAAGRSSSRSSRTRRTSSRCVPNGGGRWVAHEHDDQAVRQRRRAARGDRGLRPRRDAPDPRRRADRRHRRRTSSRRRCRASRRPVAWRAPGIDFMSKPDGRRGAVRRVLQEGGLRLRQVRGRREDADGRHVRGRRPQKAAEVAKENFEKMGFKIKLRLVTQDAMYTKFCNVAGGQGRDLPERRAG